MRTVTLIRHAESTANKTSAPAAMSAEDLAFKNRSAGLTDEGELQCVELALALQTDHGIYPPETPVAVSNYERTRLTAKKLGFLTINTYPEIDEVEHNMDLEELRTQLRRNEIPTIAVEAGRSALKQAPSEDVWIAHGLLIAGICIELGTANQYDRPVPEKCEVRYITF